MKSCTICHTGIHTSSAAALKDGKVYLLGNDGQLHLPKEMFMAKEECQGGLIQYEIQGKWGFVDIHTGNIVIEPVWDYAGPFYNNYAHVVLGGNKTEIFKGCYGTDVKQGGDHGYIGTDGDVVIPLEYVDAISWPYRDCFVVSKDGKWGMIDHENKSKIPFEWTCVKPDIEYDLIFCAKKKTGEPYDRDRDGSLYGFAALWGVYDKDFNCIIPAELDEAPITPMFKGSSTASRYGYERKYLVIRKGKKYGVLCKDGRLIANIEFSKKQVVEMVNNISGRRFEKDLYNRLSELEKSKSTVN